MSKYIIRAGAAEPAGGGPLSPAKIVHSVAVIVVITIILGITIKIMIVKIIARHGSAAEAEQHRGGGR